MQELTIELEENHVTVPCKNIKNFYFIKNELVLQTQKETFKLTRFGKKQFFYHLGLRWRTINNENRELLIANAIHKRAVSEKHPLVFRKLNYHKNYVEVGSVVTTEYVEVPVDEVRERFEKTLSNLKIEYKLSRIEDGEKATYFCYEINTTETDKGRILTDMTLIAGHSGDKSIEIVNGFVVETCGNRLTASKFGVLIHRNDTKKQILENLEKVVFSATKYLQPALERIVQVENSKDVENIEEYFGKVIQDYPVYIKKLLREHFYGKYKNLKGLWRISQTLSDVGTNAEISEIHRPRLQEQAFNIFIEE